MPYVLQSLLQERVSAPAYCAILIAGLACADASADELKLPRSAEDYKALLNETRPQGCTNCGVVVRIRSEARPSARKQAGQEPGGAVPDGPGRNLATIPIAGAGGAAKEYREPAQPDLIHVVTVRYDNGAYGLVELDDEPKLREGDRVRVSDGAIELE